MPIEWYVNVNGGEIGPLSDDGLREMVATRQLTPDDRVRKWQFGDWVPAAKVRGLFQQVAGPNHGLTETGPPSHPRLHTATAATVLSSECSTPTVPVVARAAESANRQLLPCPDCGMPISHDAKSCPNCGHPFFRASRGVAIALALILGSFGAHKFYLRKPGQAVIYLLFFWTYIPGIVGLIEGFQYLFMDDETFAGKFGSSQSAKSLGLARTPKNITTSERPAPRRWILWAGTAFAVLAVIGLMSDPDQSGGSGASRRTGSQSSGPSLAKDTSAAINETVYSRMLDLAVAGDDSGIATLRAAGLVVYLPEDTQVRVINLGSFTTEIKVESGPHAGRYFIVATENINR